MVGRRALYDFDGKWDLVLQENQRFVKVRKSSNSSVYIIEIFK